MSDKTKYCWYNNSADRLATEKAVILAALLHLIFPGTISGDSKMSKKIPLTQGQFAIVDDEDYEWLMQWKWCTYWSKCTKSFYAVRGIRNGNKTCLIYMAREILGLKRSDKCQSDHINHNTLDNREINLRTVTHQQNHFNRKNPKGYCWHKWRKKLHAQITLNGKRIHLGYFLTTKEAHKAYLTAKKKYHKF